jgi:hypothetical protein
MLYITDNRSPRYSLAGMSYLHRSSVIARTLQLLMIRIMRFHHSQERRFCISPLTILAWC